MLKNITFNAEKELIEKARQKAANDNTTLNATFRQWLVQYTSSPQKKEDFEQFMDSLSYVDSGQHFSRDDLNER